MNYISNEGFGRARSAGEKQAGVAGLAQSEHPEHNEEYSPQGQERSVCERVHSELYWAA